MKALVVGGNGFIGSHLVDALLNLGWGVTVLDVGQRRFDRIPGSVKFIQGDLSQPVLVREALTGIDIVYHLAWGTIHEISNRDPAQDVLANVVPGVNLLEACTQADIDRIVFTSSGGTVYGPALQLPIPESHPKRPINSYGITKLTVERYLHLYHHLHGLEYAILRPSVPYGPRQSPLGRQGAAAVFLHRVSSGLPLTIWGDGTVTRDYFYVSDLVSALVAAAQKPLTTERIFNIGGDREISVNELIAEVETVVGRSAVVTYEPGRSFDVPRLKLDTSAARTILEWKAEISLASGLAKTFEWISSAILANDQPSQHHPAHD